MNASLSTLGLKVLKQAVVVAALTTAMVAAASAQCEPAKMTEGTVTYYSATGGIVVKTIPDKTYLASLSKEFRAFPAGTLVMMHDGKLYVSEDKKMADGQMLSDAVMKK
jgi:hypothetical protein